MPAVGAALLSNRALSYLVSGDPQRRLGNAHPTVQPQDVFAARDGHLVVAVGNDSQFIRFCSVIDRSDLATDERFSTNAARARNRAELTAILANVLVQRGVTEWLDKPGASHLPAG